MPNPLRFLPKVNPPRLSTIVQRERIFKLFDDAHEVPVLWVAAPPGSGKTTAVASYLASRQLPKAWLQLDRGDNDPASFFHFLSIAIALAVPRKRWNFPIFESDYQKNPDAFARGFFRYLATRLSSPIKIVFDNAQEIESTALARYVSTAVAELPRTVQLVIVSRERPTAALIRLEANREIQVFDDSFLFFTLDEAKVLYEQESSINAEWLTSVHALTSGWAAGLVLARAQLENELLLNKPAHVEHEKFFNYFAIEVFENASKAVQNFLIRTAYLPIISANTAKRLSENEQAGVFLETLCDRNLFVLRKASKSPIYEYHSLFRGFLINKAEKELTPIDRRLCQQKSAEALRIEGYVDDAIALYTQIEDWAHVEQLILENADKLCCQGRHQTLQQLILSLPESVWSNNGRLLLWLSEAFTASDEQTAKRYQKAALAVFTKNQDVRGQLLSASMFFVNTFPNDYRDADELAQIISRLSKANIDLDRSDSLIVSAGKVAAGNLGLINLDTCEDAANRVVDLVQTDIDINRRFCAAMPVLQYLVLTRLNKQAEQLVTLLSTLSTDPGLTRVNQLKWYLYASYYFAVNKYDHITYNKVMPKPEMLIAKAEELAKECHLPTYECACKIYQASMALREHDLNRAETLLQSVADLVDSSPASVNALYHHACAELALVTNKPDIAKFHATRTASIYRHIHYPLAGRSTHAIVLATAFLLNRNYQEAIQVANTIQSSTDNPQRVFHIMGDLIRGYAAIKLFNDIEGLPLIARALCSARETHYPNFFLLAPAIARDVCAIALEASIESDFVRSVAAQRKLLVPEPDWDDCPWPIKIYSLGKFSLVVNNESASKLSGKLLELLQALVAKGGHEVAGDDLIRLLWPGRDRVGGHHALETAIYRLRKLMGDESCLTVKRNTISLNPERVWIDAWSLEVSLDKLLDTVDLSHHTLVMHKIGALYRGHLLADASQKVRSLIPSVNLWTKVQGFLLRFGGLQESSGYYESALDTYKYAIRLDPLATEFYQALMQTYIRHGRSQQALDIYHACQQSYRRLLNKEPAGVINKLAETLTTF